MTTTKPHRTKLWITAAVTATALLGGGGYVAWQLAAPPAAAQPPQHTTAKTAEATVGPMTSSLRLPGKIGFAGVHNLAAGTDGVLTERPVVGTVISPGQVLHRVNNQPITLMRGALPAWRAFESGMRNGPDVRQLEQNLAEQGYFSGTVDEEFTHKTTQAIRAWQKDRGFERDGVLPVGVVQFAAGDVRIGDATANVGDTVGAASVVSSVSDAAPIVTTTAPVSAKDELEQGAAVGIGLPGGGSTTGTITTIGAPTEKEENGKKQLVLPVTVTPDDPAALAGLAALTAQLSFSRQSEEEVLQVPVESLVALTDGAFGVEVVRKGTVERIPVELGRFFSGNVEITKGALKAGDDVVVPS